MTWLLLYTTASVLTAIAIDCLVRGSDPRAPIGQRVTVAGFFGVLWPVTLVGLGVLFVQERWGKTNPGEQGSPKET